MLIAMRVDDHFEREGLWDVERNWGKPKEKVAVLVNDLESTLRKFKYSRYKFVLNSIKKIMIITF